MIPIALRRQARRAAGRALSPRVRAAGRAVAIRLGVSPAAIARVAAIAPPPIVTVGGGPPLVEIDQVVSLWPGADGEGGASLLNPRLGSISGVYALDIGGVVSGQVADVSAVDVRHESTLLRTIPVTPFPLDATGHAAGGRTGGGFRARVGLVGVPLEFDLSVEAVRADASRVPLASIRGRRRPVRSGYDPVLRPLMVTAPGRMGTTWLMRLASEHPAIVAVRTYPYEAKPARYWLHLVEVLSQPADHLVGGTTQPVFTQRRTVGANTYYPGPIAPTAPLDAWFGRAYVERLAAFGQQSIDETYLQVAAAQGQAASVYFAEKHAPDRIPGLAWELYPDAREVFLIRDYRDVLSSVLAFNARRGYDGFGRDGYDSDEAYVRERLGWSLRRMRDGWQARSGRSHLIRYEDLIVQPSDTVGALFAYLDLDASEAMVAGVLARASAENAVLRQHQTSDSPAASIGRWRRDLNPALQAVCADVLGEDLAWFGYDI